MLKRIFCLILLLLVGYFVYDNNIFEVKSIVRDIKKEVVVVKPNSYKKDLNLSYVKNTTDFVPNNYQELLNIYYTAMNSGWKKFVFYCPDEYKDCIDDVKTISEDRDKLLSHLNSFVHPYNTYNNIYTTYYKSGKVKLEIVYLYDKYVIEKIDAKVDKIINENIKNDDTITNKIKTIHDYLINNTKYDTKKIDDFFDNTYQSTTAYGLLFEGYAVCSGYADTMAIFLEKFNVPNIKVATNKHVWNLVYIDNEWQHIDLTWDDPITETGEQILSTAFLMITGEKIKSYDTGEHNFNTNIYPEAQ